MCLTYHCLGLDELMLDSLPRSLRFGVGSRPKAHFVHKNGYGATSWRILPLSGFCTLNAITYLDLIKPSSPINVISETNTGDAQLQYVAPR